MLVVDAGHTRAQALQRAVEALARSKTKVLGAILNKLRERGHGYYYAYTYYSYASGDGADGHRKRRLLWGGKSRKPEESKSHA